ncbi:MAG: nuclear transport factor 2 family protein [Deinococcota bacterium]
MTDEENVLQVESIWSSAPLQGDLATITQVVADDWLGISPTGTTMSKADLFAMLTSHPNMFDTVSYSDIKVKVFGDTAIVSSMFEGIGQEMNLTQHYLRVYVKRQADWQCVVTQIIPVVS